MSLKKIRIKGLNIPAVVEPVLIEHVLLGDAVGYRDHTFKTLGHYAPATRGGGVNCHELISPMMHYDYIVGEASGVQFAGKSTQAKHALLISSELTWALPQVKHILDQHVADPSLGLLSQEVVSDGEYALNLFPVHCCGRVIVCMATIQFDPKSQKFDLFNHEFTNPDEVQPGSRVFLRIP